MPGSYSPRPSAYGVDTTVPATERYRIIGRIASGGMAEIYLARMKSNAGVEREVVLKRLLPELQSDHEFTDMFRDEATIASQLSHPNIVQIFELGDLDGSMFIAMEFLRGVNLRDLLARLHAKGEQLPIPLAVRIMCGALDGLNYAHHFQDPKTGRQLNVVHRDVSPQNIIVTFEGTVKLVDFGVAKAEGRLHQTRAGLVKGKFAYMSPEQVTGGAVDGRSDTFALTEVFYELLLKRHPFYATSDMDVLRAILDCDPPHPSKIDPTFPPGLAAVFVKALKKNPGDRHADAAALQDALERYLLEARTPATTIMLGRFVREAFSDRVALEQRARESGDDALLIDAMQAGRAEQIHYVPPAEPAQARPKTGTGGGAGARGVVVPSDYDAPEPYSDDATVAVSAPRAGQQSQARSKVIEHDRGGGRGAPQPQVGAPEEGHHLKNQVRSLFDDPVPDMGGHGHQAPPPQGPPHGRRPQDDHVEDAGEMPTMLGTLSPHDMAQLQATGSPSAPMNGPQVMPGPGQRRDGMGMQQGGMPQPKGPATGGPVITRGQQQGARDPAEGNPMLQGMGTKVPPQQMQQQMQQQPGGPPVTSRSETVIKAEEAGTKKGRFSDKAGLLFFVAGLGALVGAVIYAVMLFTTNKQPTMNLIVQSTPPGATILLDSKDIGATTPQTIPNIASDKPHTIELRLEGYQPYQKSIEPAPSLGEYIINWRFVQKK